MLCFYIRQHRGLWQLAREQIKQLEQLLEQQQLPFSQQLARLKTVPSVGPIVALTALAVFSDVSRFATAKQAASYAGLVPSTDQSGARDRHGKITKQGSAELRAMLCEAAHHAAHRNHPLNPYFRKLAAKHGYKMAVSAVAHRLCRILYSMLKHQADFDVSKLAVECGPFARKSQHLYRLKLVPVTTTNP